MYVRGNVNSILTYIIIDTGSANSFEQMHEQYNLLEASCVTEQKCAHAHVHVAITSDSDAILRAGINYGYLEPCDDNKSYIILM